MMEGAKTGEGEGSKAEERGVEPQAPHDAPTVFETGPTPWSEFLPRAEGHLWRNPSRIMGCMNLGDRAGDHESRWRRELGDCRRVDRARFPALGLRSPARVVSHDGAREHPLCPATRAKPKKNGHYLRTVIVTMESTRAFDSGPGAKPGVLDLHGTSAPSG